MKAKLIALVAAALMVVDGVAVVAVASPDSNGNDSSSRHEKQLKQGDKSLDKSLDKPLDKSPGVREGSKSERRQDARLGNEKSWDDGYDDSRDDRYDDSKSNDGAADDVKTGAALTTTPTSFDDSKDKAEGRDKDSRHKEGSKADRRSDSKRHVDEIFS